MVAIFKDKNWLDVPTPSGEVLIMDPTGLPPRSSNLYIEVYKKG